MTDFAEYQQDLLKRIAATLGVSYADMARDFTRAEQESIEWWRRYYRLEAERLAAMRRWFQPALDRLYWQVTWTLMVPWIVGHDPQRLLSYQGDQR